MTLHSPQNHNQHTSPLDEVDQILHALCATQPAPGMADRLLLTLTSQAEEVAPAGKQRRVHLFAMALGASALAAVVLLVLFFPVHRQTGKHTATPPHPLSAAQVHGDAEVPLANAQLKTEPNLPGPAPAVHLSLSAQPRASYAFASSRVSVAVTSQASADAQALDDLDAPSQPFAPFTPSRNEQLLGKVVTSGFGSELARLAEARTPERSAAEAAAFHAFFEPHLPPLSTTPGAESDTKPHAGSPARQSQP